jgi:hypothetical protein
MALVSLADGETRCTLLDLGTANWRGHEFNQPQFPELAADIRRLTGR